MRNIGLNNDFDREKLNRWFCFNELCFYCGKYSPSDFHHIKGRISNSIFNACPIHNHICHLYNGKLHHKEIEDRLLENTFIYLMKQKFNEFNDEDRNFLAKNIDVYRSLMVVDNLQLSFVE
jgi:hypothetical protein